MPVLSVYDVAAALRQRLPGVHVTAIHKLLYYCQGHHLAATGEPLFSESIMAWDLGPVVGQMWKAEKLGEAPAPRAITDEGALNTIGYVVSRYGGLRPSDLVRLTHGEAPWREADRTRMPNTSAKIPLDTIRAYFLSAEEEVSEEEPLPDTEVVAKWLADARPGPDLSAPLESAEDLLTRARG